LPPPTLLNAHINKIIRAWKPTEKHGIILVRNKVLRTSYAHDQTVIAKYRYKLHMTTILFN